MEFNKYPFAFVPVRKYAARQESLEITVAPTDVRVKPLTNIVPCPSEDELPKSVSNK
jgi:hypothetical protein